MKPSFVNGDGISEKRGKCCGLESLLQNMGQKMVMGGAWVKGWTSRVQRYLKLAGECVKVERRLGFV